MVNMAHLHSAGQLKNENIVEVQLKDERRLL